VEMVALFAAPTMTTHL